MGEKERIEYIKATISTTTQGIEALASVLDALGVAGFSVEDPKDLDFIMASKDALAWDYIDIPNILPEDGDIPPEDGEARLTFWLKKEEEAKLTELRAELIKLKSDEQDGVYGKGADFGRLRLDTETVCDDDWKDKYKERFHAFSPCEGILVAPPWEDACAAGGQIMIVIDPGMAFGTGSHETTAMCLARLKELIKPGDLILDAGTGSGILAIAAAMLGASAVHAVELDSDAAASAARNIEANGVSGIINLSLSDVSEDGALPAGAEYDLITANLTYSLLEKILPVLKNVLKEEGAVILSGILDAQEERIMEALENEDMRAIEVVKNGEWLMIEARK